MTAYHADRSPEPSARELRHREAVRRLAPEGMVLLENNGVLPLLIPGSVALFGGGARHTIIGGSGSGEVNVRSFVSVEEGFKTAGFRICSTEWLDEYDSVLAAAQAAYQRELAELVKTENSSPIITMFRHPFVMPEEPAVTATEATLAVYVISRSSGEGKDRQPVPGDYFLRDCEKDNLTKLRAIYPHLVVLLNVGGVIDTAFLRQLGADAILLMSQPGISAGDSVVDALLGTNPPSGRLSDTWAERWQDYPSSDTFGALDGDLKKEPYREDIYVGYRYFDSFNRPVAYPFGFGLDYTDYRFTPVFLHPTDSGFEVTVEVCNVGNFPGKAVAALYSSAPNLRIETPVQQLVAFGKTELLAPNDTETLSLFIPWKNMASFCEEDSAWVLEAGRYTLRMGRDSRATHSLAFVEIDSPVTLEAVTRPDFPPLPFVPMRRKDAEALPLAAEPAPAFRIHGAAIKPEAPVSAEICPDALKWAEAQSDELLAALCVGSGGNSSIVGSAAAAVPGAAGETDSVSTGLPSLILADGPAGIRITPEFRVLPDGSLIQKGNHFMDIGSLSTEKADAGDDYYQYCIAIPIATLIAQTWNVAAAKELGDIIGAEMEHFGVHFWLAPGMNLHRHPFCGRNFEYYSEDPLLSGSMAASITQGVQAHPNTGTTPKHFACNSQEDNRNYSDSLVSHRALRELYLRGFEICIREAQPKSLMTSYNFLNGIHTANHKWLLTDVLRHDWGFSGFVMTDWGTTGGSGMIGSADDKDSVPALCIAAGNDLIMPGQPYDREDICKSLRGETAHALSRDELVRCAARIASAIGSFKPES